MSSAASSNKGMTNAVATGTIAAVGTYGIVRWIIKAPMPHWRPALFSFLIEVATHWKDGPIQKTLPGKKTAGAAWALPSQLGWYVGGTDGGFMMRTPRSGLQSGFYQAAVSFAITAIVWYVAARGFFNAKHNTALWYAGVFGIIGGYGGYLQGDQPDASKLSSGDPAIRLPFGGGYGRKV